MFQESLLSTNTGIQPATSNPDSTNSATASSSSQPATSTVITVTSSGPLVVAISMNSQAGTSGLAAGTSGLAAGTSGLAAGTSGLAAGASAKVPVSSSPDKCPCGEDKPVTISRSAKCIKCGKHTCMIKGCKARYDRSALVVRHQKTHTPEEIEEHRKYRQSHCPCGAIKNRVAGREFIRCPECKRFWCMVGECNTTFVAIDKFTRHKSTCPFAKPQFKDTCSKCGYSPKIRDQIIKKCPNCGVYWCLISSCSYEHDKELFVLKHQSEAHL